MRLAILARLAYSGPDGLPRMIPIEFHWDREEIVVCAAPTVPKVIALATRSNVAQTVNIEDVPATALLIRGTATIEIVQGPDPERGSRPAMMSSRQSPFGG